MFASVLKDLETSEYSFVMTDQTFLVLDCSSTKGSEIEASTFETIEDGVCILSKLASC